MGSFLVLSLFVAGCESGGAVPSAGGAPAINEATQRVVDRAVIVEVTTDDQANVDLLLYSKRLKNKSLANADTFKPSKKIADGGTARFESKQMSPGEYTLEVRACRESKCSKKSYDVSVKNAEVLRFSDGGGGVGCDIAMQAPEGAVEERLSTLRYKDGTLHLIAKTKEGIDGSVDDVTAKFGGYSTKSVTFEIPTLDWLQDQPLVELRSGTAILELPIQIRTNRQEWAGTVKCSGKTMAISYLAGGSRTFPKDEPPQGDTVIFDPSTFETYGGEAKTLKDIDLVTSISEPPQRKASPCKYRVVGKNQWNQLHRRMNGIKAEIVERRTGKVVAEKSFYPPAPTCPKEFTATGAGGTLKSKAERSLATEWTKKYLATK